MKHMKAYIIGVNHGVQYQSPNNGEQRNGVISHFKEILVAYGEMLSISMIGEEFSVQALGMNGVSVTVAQMIAIQLGIPHVFCDPDEREREILQVRNNDDREHVWLSRIQAQKPECLLFVCGEDHVDSFTEKLEGCSVHVEVIVRNVAKDWELLD